MKKCCCFRAILTFWTGLIKIVSDRPENEVLSDLLICKWKDELANSFKMREIFVWLCNIILVTSYPSNYNLSRAEPEDGQDYKLYEEESDVDYYVTVYDSIRDSSPDILTAVERRYRSHKQHHHDEELSPLIRLVITNLTLS